MPAVCSSAGRLPRAALGYGVPTWFDLLQSQTPPIPRQELHGIFKAACDGAWEIDEYGEPRGERRRDSHTAGRVGTGLPAACSRLSRLMPHRHPTPPPLPHRPRARPPPPPLAGWTDGTRRTPYPCQVQVEVYLACPPLPAATFRPLIAENLIGGSDKFQVNL